MFGLHTVLLLLAVQYVISDKSFTIVLDTTISMREEINILKNNMATVAQATRHMGYVNYILIPFGDNDVGPPLIASKPEYLTDLIHLVEVSGGNECPEDSLAAMENALQISKPNSLIYVFTDAQAKNSSKLESIKNLCQKFKSQIIIFQSGNCVSKDISELENTNTYYEIGKNCDGSVFHFSLDTLHHAFKYMKEITKVEWSDINSHATFTDSKQFTFTMDMYTKDFIVAVSGNHPTISIRNIFGNSPQIEKIIDTRAILVIRVVNAEVGEYTTDVTCQGTALATFYRRKEISFRVGFSPLQPKSFWETSLRPLPDVSSYMLIALPEDSPAELVNVQLQMADKTVPVEHRLLDETKQLYVAEFVFVSNRTFKIIIRCKNKINYEEVTGTSGTLAPQRIVNLPEYSAPIIEILETESILVDYGTGYTTSCKINSNPKPEIWWEDDAGNKLTSESALLQLPSTYISYVTIENATKNNTITCKCINDEGENAVSFNLYVNRTLIFEVLQTPSDLTIEFGKEGKLYCEANTYPEATIKWYHNGSMFEPSPLPKNNEIVTGEHALFIRSMGLDDTGEYKCEITNEVQTESYTANVYITGLEAPKVQVEVKDILLKPGDFTEEECIILKGIPVPEVTWKYKTNNDNLDNLPDGVTVDGNFLKIPSADTGHGGFYVCEAINVLGMDAQEVAVKVQYPPNIKNKDEIKIVEVGDFVELPCDVDAVPKASVQWDLYQDDVIIELDDHHHIDDRYTHRFYAQREDSGMYHCVAENVMGRAVRTITLNVLVGPYIEHLPWEVLSVMAGTTLVLPCKVTHGNPVPSTKWEFISASYATNVLLRGHSMGNLDLVLQNVTRRQQGTYQCIAENEVGPDIIKVQLKVL